MSLSRRDFLKIAGITATSALGFAHEESEVPPIQTLVPLEKKWIPGVEQWKSTTCLQCEAGCGIRVKLVEGGRGVKIEGNPAFPVNQGGTCPKGQAALQLLYNPDRLKYPLKRTGRRGEGKWQRMSWEEAIALLVQQLSALREKNEPHALAIWGNRLRSHTGKLMARFLEAFGSPNLIDEGAVGTGGALEALYLTQGTPELMAYDFESTNYLLSFGTPLLEAWRPGVYFLRIYGHLRRGRPGIRTKIVQIDTRFSVSAAKADEWVAIKPGTEGALALGIAHVLLREDLYDKAFVEAHTFGFEDWSDENGAPHVGFKTLVLRDYSPEKVSQITGVPVDKMVRLAWEFATHRPSVALGERGFNSYTNDVYNQMAIHALNALVGSIDAPGGVILQKQPPLAPLPEIHKDEIAEQGVSRPRITGRADPGDRPYNGAGPVFVENILKETPYPLQGLFLYHINPLYDKPNPARFRQALEKIPWIVSFSSFMEESTAFADLILPDPTFFEKWEDDPPTPSVGYAYLGLRQPVVKPLYDTLNPGDVLIKVAKGLGGTVAESFPWNHFEEVIATGLKGIFEARRGSIRAETFQEFQKKLLEAGGWWDAAYPFGELRKRFPTPSGKFEFYSQTLKKSLEEAAEKVASERGIPSEQGLEEVQKRLGLAGSGEEAVLPHYRPARFAGEATEYPFYLNPYKPMTQAEEMGANQPWLMEIYGTPVNAFWNTWVEINPTTAKKLNLKDQDLVWIESVVGKIKTRVKVYPGAAPDTVNIPFGLGHQTGGRWAQHRGANPNEIIADDYDLLSGTPAWMTTRVKIYKA